MTSRNDFLLQLLQKLGAPLMAAVNIHAKGDAAQDAQIMAALLSESVQIGLGLSQAMNLKPDDGDADAIRVSLAALAGGIVADFYHQNGRAPHEGDRIRIQKSLEAVIVFADNFAPAAEHTQRLKTLDGTPPFFDPVQTNIYAIHALLPALSAISEFSFGQEGGKMIQDVSSRLGAKAKDVQHSIATGGNAMSELVILQALGEVYGAAHRSEILRLKSSGSGDSAASADAVWKAFDTQVAMLEIVLKSMAGETLPVSSGGGSSAVKPAVEAPVDVAPAEKPPESASPVAGGSPMSFFKKK